MNPNRSKTCDKKIKSAEIKLHKILNKINSFKLSDADISRLNILNSKRGFFERFIEEKSKILFRGSCVTSMIIAFLVIWWNRSESKVDPRMFRFTVGPGLLPGDSVVIQSAVPSARGLLHVRGCARRGAAGQHLRPRVRAPLRLRHCTGYRHRRHRRLEGYRRFQLRVLRELLPHREDGSEDQRLLLLRVQVWSQLAKRGVQYGPSARQPVGRAVVRGLEHLLRGRDAAAAAVLRPPILPTAHVRERRRRLDLHGRARPGRAYACGLGPARVVAGAGPRAQALAAGAAARVPVPLRVARLHRAPGGNIGGGHKPLVPQDERPSRRHQHHHWS